jgi:acetyl esterase/lipase
MLEYRRVGGAFGGGWPDTNIDIVEGIKTFASLAKTKSSIDLSQVIIMGHSAGIASIIVSFLGCRSYYAGCATLCA